MNYCKALRFLFAAVAVIGARAALALDFADFDTNHDGVISKQEFAAHTATEAKTKPASGKSEVAVEKPAKKEKGGLVGWLERDFEIRESLYTPGGELDPSINPAKLSWTKARHQDAFYQLDAAVLWKPSFLSGGTTIGGSALGWFLQPSFEAHVSTEPTSSQNQLTYRVPLTLNYIPGGREILAGMDDPNAVPKKRFITVHTLMVSPTYQTDRHNDTRAMEAEIFYTPTIPSLAIGVRQPLFGSNAVQFLWRPYVGAELGDYLERDETTTLPIENSISRFVARAEGELLFGERFAITGSYVHRTEFNGEERSFNYGEVSALVILDTTLPEDETEPPHFTMGLTYKRGKDAPEFEDVDAVTAWLGIRF